MLLAVFSATILADNANNTSNEDVDSVYSEDKLNIAVTSKQPQFVIKLKSNPTTGYSWFLREYDANLIVPLKHSFEQATTNNLIGAPGYEVWTFSVKPSAFTVPQQTAIRMVYARPWQANEGATQLIFRVTIAGK